MPIILESVNIANLSSGPTVVLYEANENGIIMCRSRRDIMSFAARPGNEIFVKSVLDSFFDVKEQVRRIFLQIRAMYYKLSRMNLTLRRIQYYFAECDKFS